MPTNNNGYIAADTSNLTLQEGMRLYDSFSPEIRTIIQNANYNVLIKPEYKHMFKQPYWLKETLIRISHKSVLQTYGNKYPIDIIK